MPQNSKFDFIGNKLALESVSQYKLYKTKTVHHLQMHSPYYKCLKQYRHSCKFLTVFKMEIRRVRWNPGPGSSCLLPWSSSL